MRDRSNGYEGIAEAFMRARTPSIGPTVVRRWARSLPAGASVLDIGCGSGIPISEALLEEGFAVYGVDASETLIAKFRERFPGVPVECSPVEDSLFFSRRFDAAVAWGLMFLLSADAQRGLIGKVARALNRDGRLLFTAPRQAGTWTDAMTSCPSCSLGYEAYERELAANDLRLVGSDPDEGDNHYYFALKP